MSNDATYNTIAEFGPINIWKTDNSTGDLHVTVSENVETNKRSINIRTFTTSDKYSGPTKSGLVLTPAVAESLIPILLQATSV